jgi:chemotaxis protein methyltransferase CheR
VRLWSAACSSGPEPYSIAATVAELCPEAGRLDIRILATDIDPNVLSVALAGHYPREEAESLGPAQQARLFEKGNTDFPVRRQLRDLVAFRRLNLMGDWPMAGRFDVIFCRNVAIYFDKPTQERLWSRLAAQMAFGGVLFIGHSERITGPATTLLENAGTTSYRLRGGTSPCHGARTWD